MNEQIEFRYRAVPTMDNEATETNPEKPSNIKLNMAQIKNKTNCSCFDLQKRHVLMIYAFFGFLLTYALRVNLSVTIVDMMNDHKPQRTAGKNDTVPIHTSYEWSTVLQGYILSSFFYGYILTQLPAGKLLYLQH